MPIRTVAIDRDVRAPRQWASAARFSSVHSLRRVVSVLSLIALDCCCYVAAVILVPPAADSAVMVKAASWVLSPISARKTVPKVTQKTFQSIGIQTFLNFDL